MEQSIPDCVITQMRVQTMPEIAYFHVTGQPTPFADLDTQLDLLLDSLYTAKAQANLGEAGPDIIRYYRVGDVAETGQSDLFLMEVGIPVKKLAQPAGAAQITILPPYHCAGLLLWGSMAHIGLAYETLQRAVQAAELLHTGENREWIYHFESVTSPHNLIGLHMGVR